jgi:glycosyltransferase involved in cell wall biosynthesis
MAMGKPVIATDVGGSPETIRNGVNGLLIPDGSSVAIANSVIELHHDKSEAENLGRRARAFVEDGRSWQTIAGLTLRTYEETIRISVPICDH